MATSFIGGLSKGVRFLDVRTEESCSFRDEYLREKRVWKTNYEM
jgi:hypothetical protein